MNNRFNRIAAAATVVATIGSMLLQGTIVKAADATLMSDTLSRAKISETATHVLSMTLPAFSSATGTAVVANYSTAGFTLSAGALTNVSINTGTITAVASANDVTITCTAGPCSGLFSGTFSGTNPGTSGSKTITVSGDALITGAFALAIVNDDQVTVTASVEPSITFNVGAQVAPSYTCDDTFNLNGGTVALGTLTTAAITSSDVASVYHICTRLSTNATGGAIVTVKSANASLKSTSVTGDTVPSASAAMAAGTANYGLCDGDRNGTATTTPSSAAVTQVSPFDQTCANDTAAGTVGAVTTSAQTIWSVAGPTSSAFQNIVVKAAISGTTKAHSDYTDLLTFVATGTF